LRQAAFGGESKSMSIGGASRTCLWRTKGKAHSVGQALESGFGEIVDEMRGWVWTGSPCAWHRPAGPNVREEAKAMQTWASASRAVLLGVDVAGCPKGNEGA
jgi:hypothetical protein